MKKNNLNFFNTYINDAKLNLPRTDSDFAIFLKTGPSPEKIADFLMDRYFPIAYLYAFKILTNRYRSEDLMDKASTLALDTLEAQIKDLRQGEFKFQGKSRYSSYLFGFLKGQSYVKISIPLSIKRHSYLATEVYKRVFQRRSDTDILGEFIHSRGEVSEKVVECITLAREYIQKKKPVEYEREQFVGSYDQFLEEPEFYREPGTPTSAEDDAIKTETYKDLHSEIDQLEPTEKTLLEEHFFKGEALKDIGQMLGLENPVYTKNKVVAKLGKRLKHLRE